MHETKYPHNLQISGFVGGAVTGGLGESFCFYTRHVYKPGEIYKVIFKEAELHYEDLQIRYHRAIFILYRSVITLIGHFTMSGQILMPAIGIHRVGLD